MHSPGFKLTKHTCHSLSIPFTTSISLIKMAKRWDRLIKKGSRALTFLLVSLNCILSLHRGRRAESEMPPWSPLVAKQSLKRKISTHLDNFFSFLDRHVWFPRQKQALKISFINTKHYSLDYDSKKRGGITKLNFIIHQYRTHYPIAWPFWRHSNTTFVAYVSDAQPRHFRYNPCTPQG